MHGYGTFLMSIWLSKGLSNHSMDFWRFAKQFKERGQKNTAKEGCLNENVTARGY